MPAMIYRISMSDGYGHTKVLAREWTYRRHAEAVLKTFRKRFPELVFDILQINLGEIMEKCLLEYFREAAENDQRFAERVVKVLAANDIYSIDLLMEKTSDELYAIKGIGDRAIRLIGIVMTKEQAIRDQKKDIYEKNCHDCECTTLQDWFKKAGCTYLESCVLQKIMREWGVKSVDIFMKMKMTEFGKMKGIGPKRLQTIEKTKKLIAKKHKNSSR